MWIREVLLSLPSFPDAVPEPSLESACLLARRLGARLTAQLTQLDSNPANWRQAAGEYPVDFGQLMVELLVKSEANAAATAESLTSLCNKYGVILDLRRGLTVPYAASTQLVDAARLHDLVVLPVPELDASGTSHVQAALFGSGRPVVLLPSARARLKQLDRIMVAWDYSREAARALSDALPILEVASHVRIVIVLGEKHMHPTGITADLDRFLSAHEIKYHVRQASLESGDIGHFLMNEAEDMHADMLVMGAYGHSRFQEFVFGGATRGVVRNPVLPVLLSH